MLSTAGERLDPDEILAQIDAGGMGEVCRARDTKLDRAAAIQVLPATLAQHPDRLARFEREAKLQAALNPPNIAAIYGVQNGAIDEAERYSAGGREGGGRGTAHLSQVRMR